MITRIFLSFILLTFGIAHAQITGLNCTGNGVFEAGNECSIVGSGFGTKSQAEPYSFLNLEDGTVGTNIDTPGTIAEADGWESGSDDFPIGNPKYNNTRATSGTQSLISNPDAIAGDMRSDITLDFGTGQTFFVWYDFYLTGQNSGCPTSPACSGSKIFRIQDTNGNTPELVLSYTDGASIAAYDGNGSQLGAQGISVSTATNRWETHFVYFDPGTQGSSNGFYKFFQAIQGSVINPTSESSLPVLTDSDRIKRVKLGAEWRSAGIQVWKDNIYVDGTGQTLIFCNNTTINGSNRCEIQVPKTVWNDGIVTFTVRQGSFASNTTGNLILTDVNFNEISNFSATLGQSYGGPAPTPNITGVKIQ